MRPKAGLWDLVLGDVGDFDKTCFRVMECCSSRRLEQVGSGGDKCRMALYKALLGEEVVAVLVG